MRKRLLFLFLICSTILAQAQHIVTGIVTSSEDKQPIIGAAVMVKGTQKGTVTDYDGNYSVDAPLNSTLVFSYMGMKTQEIKVTGNKMNVVLQPSAIEVGEVVVTAMGVKQEKKNLNFAVSTVNSNEIMVAKPTNFVDALQGKVAGINLANAGGSPNGASRMVIRGISSVNPGQSNEPLFIIDGIPVSGGATAAAQINPNDIENITVLKGAAAAALYGQEAASGAIMVTTKTGKSGKIVVNANASWQIDNVVRAPEIQATWGPGVRGVHKEQTMGGWGSPLTSDQTIYDNVGDYFRTGLLQKYDLAVSGGSELFNAYVSGSYSNHEGVAPGDYLDRVNFMIKASFNPSKTVNFNFNANIMNSKSRGIGNGVMGTIYNWPINDNMRNYKNSDGSIRWLYEADLKQKSPLNPYWSRFEDSSENESTRNIMQANGSWQAFKGFKLDGRIGYDFSNSYYDGYWTPRWSKNDFTDEELKSVQNSIFGGHSYTSGRSGLFSAQAMATYNLKVIKDLEMNFLAGTELKMWKSHSSEIGGEGFIIPGDFYSQQNLIDVVNGRDVSLYRSKKRLYGFFGEFKLDYKNMVNLGATIRNDHTSTLAPGNNSYIYPSVTGGILFSELFGISNKYFSFGKIRGNWAKVGKPTSPYAFDEAFKPFPLFPDGGFGIDPTKSVAFETLKPEMLSSWEIGADLRFFQNKTKLDIAYYSTVVDNQIVTVRVSPTSGYILMTKNEGTIKNHGVELSLDQQIFQNNDWTWSALATFGLNRGKVVSLPEGIVELANTSAQVGADIFPTAYLGGSTMGISGKDYMRTESGQIIVDEKGYPVINPAKGIYIGNREPDFLVGLSSNLRYKNITLSFMFDFRKGGDVINGTRRSLMEYGQHKTLETYRNREILVDGVVKQADGSFIPNTKKIIFDQDFVTNYYNSVSTNFIEDGSFIRLNYVTLAYDLSKYFKNSIVKGANVSFTGRNLFLWSKYQGSDPLIVSGSASGGSGDMGIDNLNVPSTRSFSFNFNVTF